MPVVGFDVKTQRVLAYGKSWGDVGPYELDIWTDAEIDCADGLDEDNDGFADCDDSTDCPSGTTDCP